MKRILVTLALAFVFLLPGAALTTNVQAAECSRHNVIASTAVKAPIQFIYGHSGQGHIYAPYGWCYDPEAPVSWRVIVVWW